MKTNLYLCVVTTPIDKTSIRDYAAIPGPLLWSCFRHACIRNGSNGAGSLKRSLQQFEYIG
ncbi:MAG: hypothetical protein ABFD10_23645 [Prolixibacteraceae bacterium]